MPEISRFLGIIIKMYYNEHNPPHFHAQYNDKMGVFTINELQMIEGDLPKKIIPLVLEWAFEHRNELLEDWNLAEKHKELRKIDPLV